MDMFPLLFPITAQQINRIEQKVDNLTMKVQIEQDALDQFAADITTCANAIATELANLVASADNPLTDADVTALQAAVDALDGLAPPQINPE